MSHPYLHILSFILLLSACTGGEEHAGGEVDPVPPGEMVAVSFSSKLYLEPVTKAIGVSDPGKGNLEENANVAIRAYKQATGSSPSSALLARQDYKVENNGDLTVATEGGEPIYLGAGLYTFYALSVNAAGTGEGSLPPELKSTTSLETVALKNQTDYLYCEVNQAISLNVENKATVNLAFERLAARIQMTIVSEGKDDKILSATAPTVTLPLTDPADSKITLGSDVRINPGNPVTDQKDYTELQSAGDITTAAGFVADCILLPMAAATDRVLPVTILFPSVTFNGLGELTNKIYTLKIPVPADAGFASGKQYNYKVNITGNEIGFAGLTVVAWDGVNGNIPNEDMSEDQEGNK